MEPNKKQNKKISLVNKIFCSPKNSLCHFDTMKLTSLPYRVSRFWVYPTEAISQNNFCFDPTEATIQAIAECKINLPHQGNHSGEAECSTFM